MFAFALVFRFVAGFMFVCVAVSIMVCLRAHDCYASRSIVLFACVLLLVLPACCMAPILLLFSYSQRFSVLLVVASPQRVLLSDVALLVQPV